MAENDEEHKYAFLGFIIFIWLIIFAGDCNYHEEYGFSTHGSCIYRKISVGRASYEEDSTFVDDLVTPQECRFRDLTYSAPIFVDLEYTRGNQRVLRRGTVIGRIPLMIRSNRCALYQMDTLEDHARNEKIDDIDKFTMARRLIKEEGLLVGGSSGSNMVGAMRQAKKLTKGQKCVVILPDGVRNYLTKFVSDEWMIKKGFLTTNDLKKEKLELSIYRKINVGRASYEEDSTFVNDLVTPQECRLRDLTYSAPIFVDLEYTWGNQRVLRRGTVIGRIPIMIRSNRCALFQMDTLEDHARNGECRYDPGG
uniref:DNA-directed RNA polymerase n=2 Tax=Panagrolaimus sp. JU765 TaxID=591449 RepID=A0AC34RCG1_9BILA